MAKFPPSPKGDPILGHTRKFMKNPLTFMRSAVQEKGDFIIFRVLNKRVYMISDADLAKYVMQKNHKNYHKSPGYKPLRLLVGNGTFTSEGAFWLRQRRLYQPAFSNKSIKIYSSSVLQTTSSMLEEWESLHREGKTVNGSRAMMELTLEIIGRTLFSTNLGKNADYMFEPLTTALEYINNRALRSPFVWPKNWPTRSNLQFKKAVRKLDKLVYDVIDERERKNEWPEDLLTVFLTAVDEETGESMTPLQVRDECMTLFLAGHESTANVLSWVFIELAKNKDIQDRLQKELDDALEGEAPTYDDMRKLPFLVQVLNETMRLYPPIWHLGRMNLEVDELGGYPIPPKSHIRISPFTIQRNQKYWDQPNKFDPNRFEESKAGDIYPGAFIPFGNGPRLCVGRNFAMMEMTLIIAMIYQQFSVDVRDLEKIEMGPLLTLRPDRDVELVLTPRN